jgi:hypothetical protein
LKKLKFQTNDITGCKPVSSMAGFFKRVKDFFSKPAQDEQEPDEDEPSGPSVGFGDGSRQGFSVKRAVPVKGAKQPIVQGVLTDGGIQVGLQVVNPKMSLCCQLGFFLISASMPILQTGNLSAG